MESQNKGLEKDNIFGKLESNAVGSENLTENKGKQATKSEDSVSLSKDAFDTLMARLNALEANQKDLEQVQDQSKQDKLERMRSQGKLVKDVKVRVLNGEIVLGWKTIKDEVYFADGKLVENQVIQVWTEKGEKFELTQRQWASMPIYQKMEVKKESRDEEGEVTYVVMGADGKEVEINTKYVN